MLQPAKSCLDLGLIVGDLAASLAFYRDLLGLTYVGTTRIWCGTLHRLRFGESDFKLVDPDRIPPQGPVGLEACLGFRYVTFVIQNLDEVAGRLKAAGVPFEKEITEIRARVRVAMVRDPDGNVVEFVQRDGGAS